MRAHLSAPFGHRNCGVTQMGLMTLVLLFMGSVVAAVAVLIWYRKRSLLQFAIPAAATISAGWFISAVFRWDFVGHEYFLLPLVLAIALVGALVFIYQSGNIVAQVRRGWVPNLVLLIGVALPFALPASLYVEFGEAPDEVELTFPLPEGRWYVAQGGNALILNHHRRIWAQRYALNITLLDETGKRADASGVGDPEDYFAYGAIVYAPCTGAVAAVEDGHTANADPGYLAANPAGNFVAIYCDHADTTVLAAHLQPGLPVAPQERVRTGDIIGRVGETGRTSEPHLHIHAVAGRHTDPESLLLRAKGIPMSFDGRVLIRNDVFDVKF